MSGKIYNVLFLCTGNSARSILAEAIMNRLGKGRIVAHSAGSRPRGEVHPYAIDLLRQLGYETGSLRSKSWDEFAAGDAPPLDFILTVCDAAAAETCPVWPGKPATAHWGIADPAAVEGGEVERRAAFVRAYGSLHGRISQFIDLPLETRDAQLLKRRLAEIGVGGG